MNICYYSSLKDFFPTSTRSSNLNLKTCTEYYQYVFPIQIVYWLNGIIQTEPSHISACLYYSFHLCVKGVVLFCSFSFWEVPRDYDSLGMCQIQASLQQLLRDLDLPIGLLKCLPLVKKLEDAVIVTIENKDYGFKQWFLIAIVLHIKVDYIE